MKNKNLMLKIAFYVLLCIGIHSHAKAAFTIHHSNNCSIQFTDTTRANQKEKKPQKETKQTNEKNDPYTNKIIHLFIVVCKLDQ